MDEVAEARTAQILITNCHVHTFTHLDSPNRFLPWPAAALANVELFRRWFIRIARLFDPKRIGRIARYAQILETSFNRTQADIFEIVRGFYPHGTRFVVLPMDMTQMNAGRVEQTIDGQHAELAQLRAANPDTVIAFAAADPRHGEEVVEKTIRLVEDHGFAGIKLYPPTGYHPYDPVLRPLYAYAEEHGLPVLSHCSRPADVQYRGEPTERMRIDPVTGQRLDLGRKALLTYFTDPDSYLPILADYPELRVCLAHFGGAGDWQSYIERPWDTSDRREEMSWLAKILDAIRSGDHPNLWADISYTLFADDEYVYLLDVLMADERVRARTLFGSDFYVVENAELEERRRALRIRSVLGEEVFRRIAEDNPKEFLGR